MTPIYSRFPHTTTVQASTLIGTLTRIQDRDVSQYILLPWALENLPDTTWRNVWTHDSYTVHKVQKNNWGELGPDPGDNAGMFPIGLWREDRFCIEHWIRVDHLSPDAQIDWAVERVAHCQKQLANIRKQRNKKGQRKGYCHSPHYYKLEINWRESDLSQAQEKLSTLSQTLTIPLSTHLLNVGAQTGQQLVLL